MLRSQIFPFANVTALSFCSPAPGGTVGAGVVGKELRAALAGEGPQLFAVSKDLQKGCQELGPAMAIKGLVLGAGGP